MEHVKHFQEFHHQLLVEVGIERAQYLQVGRQGNGGKVVLFRYDEHLLKSLGQTILSVHTIESDFSLFGAQQPHDEVE